MLTITELEISDLPGWIGTALQVKTTEQTTPKVIASSLGKHVAIDTYGMTNQAGRTPSS